MTTTIAEENEAAGDLTDNLYQSDREYSSTELSPNWSLLIGS